MSTKNNSNSHILIVEIKADASWPVSAAEARGGMPDRRGRAAKARVRLDEIGLYAPCTRRAAAADDVAGGPNPSRKDEATREDAAHQRCGPGVRRTRVVRGEIRA